MPGGGTGIASRGAAMRYPGSALFDDRQVRTLGFVVAAIVIRRAVGGGLGRGAVCRIRSARRAAVRKAAL